MKIYPSRGEILEILDYDSATGIFTWKQRRGSASAGDVAGSATAIKGRRTSYCAIQINRKLYQAHRLAWIIVHGNIDSCMVIDHINGESTDNRIENLRLVSQRQNMRNRRISKKNKSGYSGVHWCKTTEKWVASGRPDGKQTTLGKFKTKEDAVACRKKFEESFGFISASQDHAFT